MASLGGVANPEMIALARLSRGRGQKEVANSIGVSAGLMSKVENGILPATEPLLLQLAAELHYPMSFFYRPERVLGSDSICLHHRKRKSMPSKLLDAIEAEMFAAQLQIKRLLADLEIDAPNTFVTLDLDEFNGDPIAVAQEVRRLWRLPRGPIPNLIRVIEAARGIVIFRDFGTSKLDGMSCWPRSGQPLFYLNATMPTDRLRLTLAHELGHLIMHATPPVGDPEIEANAFASEFLAPAAEIGPQLRDLRFAQLPGLKEHWRISMQAIIMAAKSAQAIPDNRVRSLFVQLSQHGYRTTEPFELSPEEPSTIVRDAIEVHRVEHEYSVDQLAQLADLLTDEFAQKYLPEQSATTRLRVLS
jgi:Zn-dependent peptidase ImmA (M78 family)/transcriptional regulator with XRE-family HTH domain